MSKLIKNYSLKNIVINLLGNGKDIETATRDIISILDKKNLTHKIISLRPTTLYTQSINKMPEWKFQLAEEILSQENVIINKIGSANNDEITDLKRSIRTLSRNNRRPISLYVDYEALHRYERQYNKKQLDNSSQFTPILPILPLNVVFRTKMYEFGIYLDLTMKK